jgi:FkbM family methyltransferase
MPLAPLSLPFKPGELDFSQSQVRTWLAETQARKADLDIFNRPLILLGAGSVLAQDFVTSTLADGRVIALVDNARNGQSQSGVPVIGDAELLALLAKTPDAIGVLCCGSENAIAHFTQLWGQNPQPLMNYFEVISLWPLGKDAGSRLGFLPSFSDVDAIIAQHEAAKSAFSDALSRQTLDAIMLYRLTWDADHIARIAKPEKAIYFEPDVMPLSDREVLVDGGAFDGDTVRDFVAKTQGRYAHIHAFEIDPVNADAFAAKTQDIPHVSLHRLGLWDKPAEMGLEHRPDNGSRVSKTATVTVPLDAMDNMDLGAVSLIKLDVEGAEVQALNGAAKLIRTHKPKLAISAYHKHDDFVQILKTLSDLRDDYKLTLRHYSPIIFDSVIYAI